MQKREKIAEQFVYDGLGFPVILDKVSLHNIRGEWLPKIDIERLADIVFKALPSKPSKFTGNEIKFIRTYLDESKSSFGAIFKLSHTAIAKWEKSCNDYAPIAPAQEIAIRLYLKDYMNVSAKDFYKAYKTIESSVYIEEKEEPMKIAL